MPATGVVKASARLRMSGGDFMAFASWRPNVLTVALTSPDLLEAAPFPSNLPLPPPINPPSGLSAQGP